MIGGLVDSRFWPFDKVVKVVKVFKDIKEATAL